MILIFAYSDVPRKQIVDIADSLGGSIVGEIPEIYQYQIQVGFTECIIVNASYFYISKEFVRDNIDIDILEELLLLGGLGIQYCIKSELAYSKYYLNDVVENQGKLFDFVAQNFPNMDTEDFINVYI